MLQPVSSVAIVGGGTAGWLTALVLSAYCPFLRLTLIRPRDNHPIGVGESSQPDFPERLQAARVDLTDFIRSCDVTMKCGIFYRDWNRVGDHYWHPFTAMADSGTYTAAHHYQQMIVAGTPGYTYARYCASVHTSYETCVTQNLVAPEAARAFHVDAAKVARYLERFLTNVRVIEAERIEALAADGAIAAIDLGDGKRLSADLYVDCTGFARAVLGRIASLQFLPYEANVNRAVAASVPYADPASETHPYTRAHAHEHGWTWSIPLQSRIGSGYVYHADFCSRDEAETSFRRYWGEERMRDVEVKHIAFDSAALREPWHANVVAIGLSAGFIEPLEATGLSWTIGAADLLSRSLASRYFDAQVRARYNALMQGYVYDVQDFVDAHYKLSARRDSPFWRYHTSRAYPERLEHRLALYAAEMPNAVNRTRTFPWAFNEVSWIDILNGYEFRYAPSTASAEERARAERALREIASAPRSRLDPRSFAPVANERAP